MPVHSDKQRVVVFEADERAHAIDLEAVIEIALAVSITPLPSAPPAVEGAIDYRGTLIPVVSARSTLGLPSRPLRTSDHLMILRGRQGPLALHVDRVHGLVHAPSEEILGGGRERSPARAVKLDGALAIIEDVASLLSAEDAKRVDEALAQAASP